MTRLLAVFIIVVCGAAASSLEAQDDPLAHLRREHPRLLFTNDDLARALVSARTDPLRVALNKHIIATAEEILHAPPIRKPDEGASHEQDRYAVYDIVTCTMAYRLSGDERFFARARSDLLTVAGFTDWNPQHFLSVGEMSFAAAIGYDWLYSKLTPDERSLVKQAILKNSLVFADGTYGNPTTQKVMWSGKTAGNWNQVCNGGLISAALAIADEEPELARRVILGARKSMPIGMKSYAPDGGFAEGPGYWTYGTTYSAITFAELQTALGNDLGFSASAGFDRTIDYYEAIEGPFGPVFNYSDSTIDLQNSPARAYLANMFHKPFALQHTRSLLADELRREPVSPFDRGIQGTVVNRFFALHEVWFPDPPAGQIPTPPLDSHFRGIGDIATFRSAWNDSNAIFVGFKAGGTDAGHGHLDEGSFVLDGDGERWAMDLGPDNVGGNYTLPGYFDGKTGRRWTYFRANNHGHNTVTPGDDLQAPHITAPIVQFASSPQRAFAMADLTPAYPGDTAGLQRGIALLDRARVLVQDEYQPSSSEKPLHWVMITPARIEIKQGGHSATLTNGGRTLRAEILQPAAAQFRIGSTRPPTSMEMQNEGTSMLCIDVSPDAAGSAVRLAVLLTPVGSKWPQLPPPAVVTLSNWTRPGQLTN